MGVMPDKGAVAPARATSEKPEGNKVELRMLELSNRYYSAPM